MRSVTVELKRKHAAYLIWVCFCVMIKGKVELTLEEDA